MKKVIFSLILLTAMLGIVEAAPFQTLGMLRTPDAYVLPHRAAEILMVGYYRDVVAPRPMTQDAKDASKGFFPYGMVGVGLFNRVELGIFAGDNTKLDGLVYFMNVKAKIIEESLRIPQISVGIDNVFSPMPQHGAQYQTTGDNFSEHPDADAYEYFSPYAVASKQAVFAGIPWMFNAGFGSNRFVGQAPRARIFNGFFTSVEMSPLRDLALQGEFDGEDFNVGIKYSYKNFGAKVGMAAIEDLAKDTIYKDNLRIAFGLSYLFDKYSDTKRRPDLSRYALDSDIGGTDVVDVGDVPTPIVTDITIPPSGTETPGTGVVVVPPGTTGTEVVVLSPTELQTPGLVTPGSSAYKELSPEVRDLLKELEALRLERQNAQKALDDLRKWIQELKKP
ncbi:MAG: hypothetical protein CVU50_03215 [Candidatus Cloacimonetes bacterium HGW-Cloacimonetes-3]|jgi:hypothetical protein|nr:MAG: hypothetical protein CVU50_03215 [Candidatus Cloacimonetes bacterium HGW-Cloacimonetes-3]